MEPIPRKIKMKIKKLILSNINQMNVNVNTENGFFLIKSEPLGRLDFEQKHCTSFGQLILINSFMQLL